MSSTIGMPTLAFDSIFICTGMSSWLILLFKPRMITASVKCLKHVLNFQNPIWLFYCKKRNIGSGVIVLRISNFHYIYKLCCKKLPFWSGDSGGEGFLKGFFRTHILIVQFVFFISKLKNDSLFTFDTVVLELTSKMFFKKVYRQTDKRTE